ncbi:hypothetical protein RDI58_007712 [Solanum bulbocastanum]|uniref:Uncharacterized protein n=1 Tax=Solanum bulbocastanum TaxID=147425 RepID=A0AAN8YHZ0_SOLBU
MDSTINIITLSKMIPTSFIAANSSVSVTTESPMEVIARLERQIGELNPLQTQSASLTQSTENAPLCTHLHLQKLER